MSFIRTKKHGDKTYYYEVAAYRDPLTKKPKQKIIRYVGTTRGAK